METTDFEEKTVTESTGNTGQNAGEEHPAVVAREIPHVENSPFSAKRETDLNFANTRFAGSTEGEAENRYTGPSFETLALQTDLQDKTLLADPQKAAVYSQMRDTVLATVRYSHAVGQPIGVDAAFKAVLAEEFFARMENAVQEAEEKVFARRAANSAASPGPLAGAVAGTESYATMPSDEFERTLARALRGELRSF